MPLALFDLDNTLLAGDSDYLWGEYLCEQGIVDQNDYADRNDAFYQQYLRGEMDIEEFLNFALEPLRLTPMPELLALRTDFLASVLPQLVAPGSGELINQHRRRGDTLAIITATNRFIAAPIAQHLGIDHLLATEPTLDKAGFDGNHQHPPCYQKHKLTNLNRWLSNYRLGQIGSYAYSDSHNDLSLLEWADNPVAVDPDDQLKTIADEHSWPVISLR